MGEKIRGMFFLSFYLSFHWQQHCTQYFLRYFLLDFLLFLLEFEFLLSDCLVHLNLTLFFFFIRIIYHSFLERVFTFVLYIEIFIYLDLLHELVIN